LTWAIGCVFRTAAAAEGDAVVGGEYDSIEDKPKEKRLLARHASL
jgi:hypothetical protein